MPKALRAGQGDQGACWVSYRAYRCLVPIPRRWCSFPQRSRDLHSKPPGAETYTPTTLSEELARHFFLLGLRELAKK